MFEKVTGSDIDGYTIRRSTDKHSVYRLYKLYSSGEYLGLYHSVSEYLEVVNDLSTDRLLAMCHMNEYAPPWGCVLINEKPTKHLNIDYIPLSEIQSMIIESLDQPVVTFLDKLARAVVLVEKEFNDACPMDPRILPPHVLGALNHHKTVIQPTDYNL